MNQHQSQLDRQLKEFRQKYYTDKIIRGALILAILISSMIFVALLSEGLFGLSASIRTAAVYGLGAILLATLGYMVLWPAAKLFQISKGINDFQIADIVKQKFPNINDKLVNLLQLKRSYGEDNSLALAAIDQKTEEIAPVKLSKAIDLNFNKKYLYLLLIPLLFLGGTYMIDKDFFNDNLMHLARFNEEFVPPPPFTILLEELPDRVVSGQGYNLKATVVGDELPAELFIFMKKNSESQFLDYSLEKESNTEFTYKLSDLKEDFSFFLGNPDVKSEQYNVKVLRRPFIKNFKVNINYPNYTGLPSESLDENVGDFKALRGSMITWEVAPQGEVEEAYFVQNAPKSFKYDEKKKVYRYSRRLMENTNYFISLQSPDRINNIDTVRYQADALADRFPSIYVFAPNNDFFVDLDPTLPLELEIADDFGFAKMELHYRFTKSGGESAVSSNFQPYALDIDKKALLQPHDYKIDLTALGLKEGDELEYFIKVWDNDGVAGPKASTTATFKVSYPTINEKYDEVKEDKEQLKEEMKKLREKAENMEESYKKIQEKLLEKKNLSFDDKRQLQQMIENHQAMMQELEQMQEKFEETKDKLQENQMISEKTLEKYEQLNDLIEKMENPELNKMLQEMQEKMDELNPEDIMKMMDEVKLNDEDIKKNLERTMELFKQLEVQEKLDELRNKLDKLAAKQENLNEKTDNVDAKKDDASKMDQLSKNQEELSKQMDDVKKDLDELSKMKEDTQTPDKENMDDIKKNADDAKKDMEDAGDDMKDSSESMEQKSGGQKKSAKSKQKSASGKQKSAKEKLDEMSKQLSQMQMQMEMEQDQENLESLRELLENLLKLSFDQEDLRDEVKELRYGDPALKDKSQTQRKLQDDMGLVSDSLDALAKRMFQIEKQILDESRTITKSMKQSQTFFRNKQVPMVNFHQQTAMTSVNNLANMLSSVMDQLQQQMKNGGMPGGGMCNKPGGSKEKMEGLGKKQGDVNKMMQQMMGSGGMKPSELAKAAAMQKAIRQQLEEMNKEGGPPMGGMGEVLKDMEETERDLLNNRLSLETNKRNQKILTRMLQSTRALKERGIDEKRESRTGEAEARKSPEELNREEFKNRLRQELLKSNQLEYSTDFIKLIEQYYQKLEEIN
ncbi:MAG: hypothetical protein AB8F95_18625 [Bacteroidia bacterium]